MIRRSHVRSEKEKKDADSAKLTENKKFLNDVLTRANDNKTDKQWVAYLKMIMKSHMESRIKAVYKVTIAFKQGLNKFVNDDLTVTCQLKGSLFQVAYESFMKNLNQIATANIPEQDRWLIPHLQNELKTVLKSMDEMIWNTTSKNLFVETKQNNILRTKGDGFLKNPLYEEIVQWTMHPRHFENGWFADHGFLDEEGMLEQ